MAKKPTRVGLVSIKSLGGKRWELRYLDPATRKDRKQRVAGVGYSEINRIATHRNQEILEGRGHRTGNGSPVPTIKEAFAASIRLSRQRASSRKYSAYQAGRFVAWLDANFAGKAPWQDQPWNELSPAKVREYVLNLEGKGNAQNSVRLALAPIKAAWRYVTDECPKAVEPLAKIDLEPDPHKPEIVCLEPCEVVALLDWLREHRPDIHGIAALQALAGLRMYEAAALRREDVDLDNLTVTVTETDYHTPKNKWSYRTVPVFREAADALIDAMNRQRIILPTGEIFVTRAGKPWSKSSLDSRWQRALPKAAEETECARLAEIPPRKLRASFATMAGRSGVPDRVLKEYLGHSSGDVLGEHYRLIDLAELRLVSSRLEKWRTLTESSERWKHLGNSR